MDQRLLIGAVIVLILLICMPRSSGKPKCRKPAPVVRCVVSHSAPREGIIVDPPMVEGSLGPTPYREDGIRAPGKTEHYKNKTNILWQTAPSQAVVDEQTGLSLDAITSEYLTPMRQRSDARRPRGPRRFDTMQSHV